MGSVTAAMWASRYLGPMAERILTRTERAYARLYTGPLAHFLAGLTTGSSSWQASCAHGCGRGGPPGAEPAPGRAPQRARRKIGHWPGTPFSCRLPMSAKESPEPTTVPNVVPETTPHPARRARRRARRCGRPSRRRPRRCARTRPCACRPGPGCPAAAAGVDDRPRAPHGLRRRPGERRQERVADRLDLRPAEARERAADRPRRGRRAGRASARRPARAARRGRVDDVGEQDGQQLALRPAAAPPAGEERLDLPQQRLGVADHRQAVVAGGARRAARRRSARPRSASGARRSERPRSRCSTSVGTRIRARCGARRSGHRPPHALTMPDGVIDWRSSRASHARIRSSSADARRHAVEVRARPPRRDHRPRRAASRSSSCWSTRSPSSRRLRTTGA